MATLWNALGSIQLARIETSAQDTLTQFFAFSLTGLMRIQEATVILQKSLNIILNIQHNFHTSDHYETDDPCCTYKYRICTCLYCCTISGKKRLTNNFNNTLLLIVISHCTPFGDIHPMVLEGHSQAGPVQPGAHSHSPLHVHVPWPFKVVIMITVRQTSLLKKPEHKTRLRRGQLEFWHSQ